MRNKKTLFLIISIGLFNTFHGILHLVQFLQSIILFNNYAINSDYSIKDFILSLIWIFIGSMSLIVGILDIIHHRNCKK